MRKHSGTRGSARAHVLARAIAAALLWAAIGGATVHAEVFHEDASRSLHAPATVGAERDEADEPAGRERKVAALAPPDAASLASCLPGSLKTRIREIERRWGAVEVISAHRPGARVAGTGRPSRHASCRAVDFRPPKGAYAAVAKWLKANHKGGVGTYSGRHNHIHIDDGPEYRWHN